MALTVSSDEHTLTIKIHPVVTQDQLHEAFQSAFKDAASLSPEYQTRFIINMVKKKGIRTGRGFVWIFNPKVYHMILGRNPDGSARINRYEDPDWMPPEEKPEPDYNPLAPSKSWADMMEEEEEMECPIIEEQLPPLIRVPAIRLTLEQQADHEDHPSTVTVHLEAALAHDIESGLSHNVLRSSALLPHMTEKSIKEEFQHFATSKNMHTIKANKDNRSGRGGKNNTTKGDVVYESYPYVKIVELPTTRGKDRIAYVTFDPMTSNASFAFHMMRHHEYKHRKTGETFVVNYTYAKSRPNQ